MPLYSGVKTGEVDSNMIKLSITECSDLLLRGCTRGSPAHSAGLFLFRVNDYEFKKRVNKNNW